MKGKMNDDVTKTQSGGGIRVNVLLPCPLCGGKEIIVYAESYGVVYVECSCCKAMMGRYERTISAKRGDLHIDSDKEAADAWNTRAKLSRKKGD